MPRPETPPITLRGRAFARAEGLAVVSRERLEGPTYQRLTRGAYCESGLQVDEQRRVEAFRAVLPPEAVLGGMTAVRALGSPWQWPPDDVQVVLPRARRVRSRAGLRVSGEWLEPSEVVTTAWGPTTSPARTAFDLARRARGTGPWQLAEAVARVDAVLHASGTPVDQVSAVAAAHPGVRGSRIARRVLDLTDPLAESPQESRLRVHIVLAGLPRPVVQYEIRDPDGRVVYRLDLAWPHLRCAAEYDGQQHRLDDRQYRHDIDRYNDLTSSWTIRRVIAEHMRSMPRLLGGIESMLCAASQ